MERNLQDAMNVARNVMTEPLLVPGGGAAEMALAQVCMHYVYMPIAVYCKFYGCKNKILRQTNAILSFALTHRFWLYMRTASFRNASLGQFLQVPTIFFLSKI